MRSLLARAIAGIRQSPGLFLTTSLSVGMSLLLIGTFAIAFDSARAWLESVVGAETLVVYLRPEIGEDAAAAIAESIAQRSEVSSVIPESPEVSAERLRAVLDEGTRDSVTGALTWSLQVRARKAGELRTLAAALAREVGVDEVDYGEGLYERLQAIERVISLGSAVLFGLVLVVCAYIVSITVSLALYVRRDEIQVQKIVGASDAFVVGPLLAEGAFAGLLGGLFSLAVLTLGRGWIAARFAVALASLGFSAQGLLSPAFAFAQVSLGVVVCTIGALIASARYLRQTE